jgi:hypothetical protein
MQQRGVVVEGGQGRVAPMVNQSAHASRAAGGRIVAMGARQPVIVVDGAVVEVKRAATQGAQAVLSSVEGRQGGPTQSLALARRLSGIASS